MITKYSVSVLAAMVAASLGVSAHANDGLEVVDLGTASGAYETFPGGMNDLGEAVVINRNLWEQNIRFELLTHESFEDFDFDDLSDAEYRLIRDFLTSPTGGASTPTYQNLATQISHLFDGRVSELDGFDTLDPETNRYTDSVDYLAHDINDQRIIVGHAGEPYLRRTSTNMDGEPAEYFLRDSFPRAFVRVNDNVVFLPSTADVYLGGTSDARAINESNQIAGRAAIANTIGLSNRFDSCNAEPEDADDSGIFNEELVTCIWRYWYNAEASSVAQGSSRSPIFIEQAHKWTLHDDGTVEAELLGGFTQTITPSEEEAEEGAEEEIRPILSMALDINNHGIAVGSAGRVVDAYNTRGDLIKNSRVVSSVVYKDGEIIPLQKEFHTGTSEATAINDNNIVVGYSATFLGSATRPRAFWVDLDELDLNDVDAGRNYPTGFFNTSGWRPRAINNHNVMVGQGEVTAQIATARPTVGFMYDINTDEITDLNTLLPCGSEYRIVDAYDINDAGEILALAVTEIAIPIDGEDQVTGRMRAVRLQPATHQPCDEVPGEQLERQGASVNPVVAGMLALFAFFITRRRVNRS